MQIIDLETLEGMPSYFFDIMENIKKRYPAKIPSSAMEDDYQLQQLYQDLAKEFHGCYLVGYHYTRASKQSILTRGLLSRSGAEIRKEFLCENRNLFSSEEISIIQNNWDKCFIQSFSEARDYRIYFNLTKYAINEDTAEPLLEYYGGEQIFMPLKHLGSITEKLKTIGDPLLIRCLLKSSDLYNFGMEDIGKIAASTYLSQIHPNISRDDDDAFITHSVCPKDIISVEDIHR